LMIKAGWAKRITVCQENGRGQQHWGLGGELASPRSFSGPPGMNPYVSLRVEQAIQAAMRLGSLRPRSVRRKARPLLRLGPSRGCRTWQSVRASKDKLRSRQCFVPQRIPIGQEEVRSAAIRTFQSPFEYRLGPVPCGGP